MKTGTQSTPELLLPFKYKIPFPHELELNHFTYQKHFGATSRDRRSILESLTPNGKPVSDIEIWVKFYKSYCTYLNEYKSQNAIKDSWHLFHYSAADPVSAFADCYANWTHQEPDWDVSPLFVEIVDEILSDGKITDAEDAFLKEKMAEYEVTQEKFNQIISYKKIDIPVRMLIVENCKDGVVTTAEKNLLIEKAAEYGVSQESLEKQERRILNLFKRKDELTQNISFRSAVSLIYLARYVLSDFTLEEQVFKELYRSLDDQTQICFLVSDELLAYTKVLIQEISKFESRSYTQEEIVDQFLGINSNLIAESTSCAVGEPERRVTIRGQTFEAFSVTNKNLPLFSHTVRGQKISVYVNLSHPFSKAASELDSIFKLGISVAYTKIQMYSNSSTIEDFFEQLHVNELIVGKKYGD